MYKTKKEIAIIYSYKVVGNILTFFKLKEYVIYIVNSFEASTMTYSP